MKALVYRSPGDKTVEDRPKPELQALGDAIVKVTKTTICGTDLHILKGDVASVRRQRPLDRPGGLNKGEFLAHRNVHRSEDETANPTIEGTS